jgi:single-strand DNA-binding protein
MANVNRVILIGNLTRDPQLRYLPSQMAVAEFGLAINHKYKTASGEQREEVCFIDCTAFGKSGRVDQPVLPEGQTALR